MSFIAPYRQEIAQICEAHRVAELFLFGSHATGSAQRKSDVDLLVRFKPFGPKGYFDNYLKLKDKLEALFNKKVDLLEAQTLRNPVLIRSINRSKLKVYG